MIKIANYLLSHYKGIYRLKTEYEKNNNLFPREANGQLADNDIYIDCYNRIQIFSFGHGILECYVPSLGRGHNIIKAIQSDLGEDIIFHIEETDSEILFRFHAKNMKKLEKYLKPKTSGASISPFSTRNLPKNKEYKIPDEEFAMYKNIVTKIPKERILSLTHMTNYYLKSLVTKKNSWEDIKADMALKGLKGKEYIHSIGKWNDYITYLEVRNR